MSLCLAAGGKTAVLAFSSFMLAWTHSVEKIEWQEDWRLAAGGLELVEARVKGSGAGMEPPENARFDGKWWHYTTDMPPVPQLVLARSGATASDWRICLKDDCKSINTIIGPGKEPVTLSACAR